MSLQDEFVVDHLGQVPNDWLIDVTVNDGEVSDIAIQVVNSGIFTSQL